MVKQYFCIIIEYRTKSRHQLCKHCACIRDLKDIWNFALRANATVSEKWSQRCRRGLKTAIAWILQLWIILPRRHPGDIWRQLIMQLYRLMTSTPQVTSKKTSGRSFKHPRLSIQVVCWISLNDQWSSQILARQSYLQSQFFSFKMIHHYHYRHSEKSQCGDHKELPCIMKDVLHVMGTSKPFYGNDEVRATPSAWIPQPWIFQPLELRLYLLF